MPEAPGQLSAFRMYSIVRPASLHMPHGKGVRNSRFHWVPLPGDDSTLRREGELGRPERAPSVTAGHR
jgi:hypothetical protein